MFDMNLTMVVATGGEGDGETRLLRLEILGGRPPEIGILKNIFWLFAFFKIFQYFQSKIGEIRLEIRLWG